MTTSFVQRHARYAKTRPGAHRKLPLLLLFCLQCLRYWLGMERCMCHPPKPKRSTARKIHFAHLTHVAFFHQNKRKPPFTSYNVQVYNVRIPVQCSGLPGALQRPTSSLGAAPAAGRPCRGRGRGSPCGRGAQGATWHGVRMCLTLEAR